MGDVPPGQLPWLLRLVHVQARLTSRDSKTLLEENARGLLAWHATLQRGLLPDTLVLEQLLLPSSAPGGLGLANEAWAAGQSAEQLACFPSEPLRTMLLRIFGKLGAARYARKYPAVRDALLRSLLEAAVQFHRTLAGEEDEEETREVDSDGNRARTATELAREEAEKRLARLGSAGATEAVGQLPLVATLGSDSLRSAVAALAAEKAAEAHRAQRQQASSSSPAGLSAYKRVAMEVSKQLYSTWQSPLEALTKAGRAFEGLEALLGGTGFDLQAHIWKRAGWGALDTLRRKLEDIKELRDLVRSLGRGGGWGPLRRAPVQHLDMSARPGLLRTVLEAQETRGLTRSGDIGRLLPAEAAMIARGRSVRAAKLLFFARLAEKGLQTYERDGWGEFPTRINPDRREVRPTADRGPILLCVDTSGSMRGARETVAKALALECMRAAREQERACYVFAFAGPSEVRELELNNDLASVQNLLGFIERVFNGGSDFNEPITRCLERLTEAKWANADILLVSDGELRAPGSEVMRKLWGAKDKLALRVHGLVVGAPDKRRADPAVLRSLCSSVLPNGRSEVLVSEFSSWASVQVDADLAALDYDDAEANARRRLAGLAHEKLRQEESRRLRAQSKAQDARMGTVRNDPSRRMPSDGSGRGKASSAVKKH